MYWVAFVVVSGVQINDDFDDEKDGDIDEGVVLEILVFDEACELRLE